MNKKAVLPSEAHLSYLVRATFCRLCHFAQQFMPFEIRCLSRRGTQLNMQTSSRACLLKVCWCLLHFQELILDFEKKKFFLKKKFKAGGIENHYLLLELMSALTLAKQQHPNCDVKADLRANSRPHLNNSNVRVTRGSSGGTLACCFSSDGVSVSI